MEILGIGPLELIFIMLIALIVFGPNDLVKAGRTLGRWMRKIVTSPEWRSVQQASREISHLPNRLMREASLDELRNDLEDVGRIGGQAPRGTHRIPGEESLNGLTPWTTPPDTFIPPTSGHPETPPKNEPD